MTRNATAYHVDDLDYGNAPAGAFKWTGLYNVEDPGPFGIIYACPCGCGALHSAPFDNIPAEWIAWKMEKAPMSRWHWDGNKEKPTLTPSLGLGPKDGNYYHWHGFLRAGVFEEC